MTDPTLPGSFVECVLELRAATFALSRLEQALLFLYCEYRVSALAGTREDDKRCQSAVSLLVACETIGASMNLV